MCVKYAYDINEVLETINIQRCHVKDWSDGLRFASFKGVNRQSKTLDFHNSFYNSTTCLPMSLR